MAGYDCIALHVQGQRSCVVTVRFEWNISLHTTRYSMCNATRNHGRMQHGQRQVKYACSTHMPTCKEETDTTARNEWKPLHMYHNMTYLIAIDCIIYLNGCNMTNIWHHTPQGVSTSTHTVSMCCGCTFAAQRFEGGGRFLIVLQEVIKAATMLQRVFLRHLVCARQRQHTHSIHAFMSAKITRTRAQIACFM